jgi:hypothetical protein
MGWAASVLGVRGRASPLAGKIVEQAWLVVSLESKGSAMLGYNSKYKCAKRLPPLCCNFRGPSSSSAPPLYLNSSDRRSHRAFLLVRADTILMFVLRFASQLNIYATPW